MSFLDTFGNTVINNMKIQTPRGTQENLPIKVIWNGKELGVKEVEITLDLV